MSAGATARYFESQTDYWKDVYGRGEVLAETYRRRQAAALSLVDALRLPKTVPALEVGCGAGFCSIELAARGFEVTAVDLAPGMIEVARHQVAAAGLAERVCLRTADTRSLPFPDQTFELAVALGLLAWLDKPESALQELARVMRPGAYVVISAANRSALHNLIDPTLNPALQPLKRWLRQAARVAGLDLGPRANLQSRAGLDRALRRAGLAKVKGLTLGFGPFTMFRLPLLPRRASLSAFTRLQRLADRGIPGIRSAGRTYLVLASREATA